MKLPLFIAFRYFFSKKKHNIINVISGISVAGISVGTMALIIVLSVFNGFEGLVVSMFNTVNPDLSITPAQGKTFQTDSNTLNTIRLTPGVAYITEVIEENVLIKYGDKQHIAVLKGVSEDFFQMSGICKLVYNGSCSLNEGDIQYALVGSGVAYTLDVNTNDFLKLLSVYVPRRGARSLTDPTQAFSSRLILPGGIFAVEYEYDSKYVITNIDFARDLLSYNNQLSALEIAVSSNYEVETVKKALKSQLGESFNIKNRFEQQELLYKVMKSEKWAIFLILGFILIIAVFNVVGTLTMLVIEKQKDAAVLATLGATASLIRTIFLFEGILISLTGALSGVFLGGAICFIQQTFGIIPLESAQSFIVDAYPVKMLASDFVLVFVTVLAIGLVAAYIPVRRMAWLNPNSVK